MNSSPLMITLIFFSVFFMPFNGHTQSPVYSESVVKYDWRLPNNSKSIPFDRPFTMVVDSIPVKRVIRIFAFETAYKNGKRDFKLSKVNGQYLPVRDIQWEGSLDADTLRIYFPALKPNKNFDVYVLRYLSEENRTIVMQMNTYMKLGDSIKVSRLLDQLIASVKPKYTDLSSLTLTNGSYRHFYRVLLKKSYDTLSDPATFPAAPALSVSEVKAIDISISNLSNFKDGHLLLEAVLKNRLPQLQSGVTDIRQIAQMDNEAPMPDILARLQNLASNRVFFDSIYDRLGAMLSKNLQTVAVDGQVHQLSSLYSKTDAIRKKLWQYEEKLKNGKQAIFALIDNNDQIRQTDFLVGNTESYDIKTAGGQILFLDAGISNLRVAGINGDIINIPKLYLGVSIYFRPIDKNTRRNRFPYAWQLPPHKGSEKKTYNLKDNVLMAGFGIDTTLPYDSAARRRAVAKLTGDDILKEGNSEIVYKIVNRPDQRIVSRFTLWQHLSINVGLTLGGMGNKDFDNFYNGNSLLVGPAFRFARSFKISAGVSLVKRSSTHPLISEKKIVAGNYISLSTDIDFIQGIKDFTSMLFK